MRTIIKRILAFLLSAICIVGSTLLVCIVCNHPSEDVENTVSSFYRELDNSLDVIMIGSSAAGKDFLPHVLWKTYGITGYYMNVGACSSNVYPSILKEVLSKQPNATILVDIDGFLVENKFQQEEDPIRLWVDSMPRNKNHLETVRALCADSFAERILKFPRYHRNMTRIAVYLPQTIRLLKKQILNVRDPLKGAVLEADPTPPELQTLNISNLQPKPLDTLSAATLEEFLKVCKDNNVQNVLFVDFPKAYSDETVKERDELYGSRVQYIRNTVSKYGYDVFSYNELDNPAGLVLNEDYRDTLHLSKSGGEKFTTYFGSYLSKNFNFTEKEESLKALWNEDVAKVN